MSRHYKVAVHVPVEATEEVRLAIGGAGGGVIGDYSHCMFTVRGQGRFLGGENSNPATGFKGKIEQPEEDRIEVTVSEAKLRQVIEAIKQVHPYEEPTIDVYQLVDIEDF